jgi:hypothetical protein
MLFINQNKRPLGKAKARKLLSQHPRILRHTAAWIDDSELCLQVECILDNGEFILFHMGHCWDTEEFREHNYFKDVTEWLLNNNWIIFYQFVQDRLIAVLTDLADFEEDS